MMAPEGFDTLARIVAEAVLNGLWQGLALTALVWIGLRFTPRTGAATRFGIWLSTLGVVLALPFVRLAAGSLEQPAAVHVSYAQPIALAGAWIVIAGVLLMRLAWSYGYVRWLARTSMPADPSWKRDVPLRFSHETSVPMVIGLVRPAILIPRALAGELTAAEVQQVLLHERAHIHRRDHWTNYALELAQALYFFHPAVWWIARELRREREIACDDAVVCATGEPAAYADCLAKLVDFSSCGPGNGSQVFHRVERLLSWSGAAGFSASRFASASLALMAAAACVQQAPALIVIPAPSLALSAPRPAIEATRQRLVTEERIERANILMQTAAARMDSAERMIRAANRQMRLAVQIAQGSAASTISPVVCKQPSAAPEPHLNKI